MTRLLTAILLAPLLLLLWIGPALAHPLAPGLLVVSQQPDGLWQVVWKTPLRQNPGAGLSPRLPQRCEPVSAVVERQENTARVRRWRVDCGQGPLAGERIGVDGLDGSRAGVLMRLVLADGSSHGQMLSADVPTFVVPAVQNGWRVFLSFLVLGIEHLLSGIDHVLFVVAVTLLVGWGRMLVWTLTLFTIGHSITLSLAALGYVHFPTFFVEALISLSVVVAAAELARPDSGGWFRRAPWLATGAFGLLHGMGFAGALAEVGLPAGEIPTALAAFNLGIELGQLAVVAVLLGAWAVVRRLGELPLPAGPHFRARLRPLPGYALGTLAAAWFWQNLALFG
jgi:hydrogenase/urease accessory protein HupE